VIDGGTGYLLAWIIHGRLVYIKNQNKMV
jgi:hypothetical protein